MSRASDIEIIAQARKDDRTIRTLDADFHALLAVTEQDGPSVIAHTPRGSAGRAVVESLAVYLASSRPVSSEGGIDYRYGEGRSRPRAANNSQDRLTRSGTTAEERRSRSLSD